MRPVFRRADSEAFFRRARSKDPETFDRLMVSADVRESGDCWPWTRSTAGGYGKLRIGGPKQIAHRVMFALCFYPPGDLEVRHICHNPGCINPAHLRAGTHRDNMIDRMLAGRGGNLKGEANGRAKLTETDVRFIRRRSSAGASLLDLSRDFGITKTAVSYVVRGKNWKHIKKEGA